MDCKTFSKNISAYIDDELGAEERALFEEHMQTCLTCRREYKELGKLVFDIRSLGKVELPRDFARDFDVSHNPKPGKKRENRKKTGSWPRRRLVSLAACFVLIVGVAVAVYATGGDFTSPPPENVSDHQQEANDQTPQEMAGAGEAAPSEDAETKQENTPAETVNPPEGDVALSALNDVSFAAGDYCYIEISAEKWDAAKGFLSDATLYAMEDQGDTLNIYCSVADMSALIDSFKAQPFAEGMAEVAVTKAEERGNWQQLQSDLQVINDTITEKSKKMEEPNAKNSDVAKAELEQLRKERSRLFREVNFVRLDLKKAA